MKRLTLLTVVVALAGATNLWAGEEPREAAGGKIILQIKEGTGERTVVVGEGAEGRVVSNVWGAGKSAADWYIESIDKIVNLTDDQKQAITTIIEARDKAVQDFRTQNAEKLQAATSALMEAYKSKDQDAIAKAAKANQELNAPMYEAMKTAMWKVLPAESPGLTQAEIREAVVPYLPEELYPGGAKTGWWAKTVQLDQEAKGSLIREATKPLRWYRKGE